ncbi:MAG: DUF2235 domain-containing protein [Acidobacteria bacterium]|nr:DUF2235 domain-containing protein [Acidobacteriota bacterium]
MSKRLVICCDGTWNTPDKWKGGAYAITNVARMALGTPSVGEDGHEQAVYYDKGVGTGKFDLLRGGILGWGLSRNIKEAYTFLIRCYEPGDDIFLFGFSRGAYTVRSLAGLIRNSGLLKRDFEKKIGEAYELYRRPGGVEKPKSNEMALFRKSFSHDTRIHFIGVWDTVGALGVPMLINIPFLSRRWTFHDVKLSTQVDNAFHALAIDEHRKPFTPAIWEQQADSLARQQRENPQRLEQVWFIGSHSDVGGGYPENEAGLCRLSFEWMVERARECGLTVEIPPEPKALDKMHDSMTFMYKIFYIKMNRKINGAGRETLHPSVLERFRTDTGYCPQSVRDYLKEL